MIKRWLMICSIAATAIPAYAQNMLTMEDAVAIALKQNYGIMVARNDSEIARLNNTAGNAGMLPNIAVNASETYSSNSIQQKLANGSDIKSPNVGFNSVNANVALTWTLFDGARMFIAKDRLEKQEELGDIQMKQQVLVTVSQVMLAYYDVVRQQQQLKAITEIIAYNSERVKISELRFNNGSSAKTELLQAKIDLNLQRSNAVLQQENIIRSKRALNILLSRNANTEFEASDSIPLEYKPDQALLETKLQSSNLSLMNAQKQAEIAGLSMREFQALKYPRLTFTTGYFFSRSDNKAGFTLFNQTLGPQAGLSLNMPLFQGLNLNRQVNTARLGMLSARYSYDAARLQTAADLQNALTAFNNQTRLLEIELENVQLAKENLDLSLTRLRLGQTNSLEASQAQVNYESALTRLNNIRYNLKAAEVSVKGLLNEL